MDRRVEEFLCTLFRSLNVMSPPLVLSVEQIDWMVETLREGIIEVQADLIAEGLWSPE